MDLAVAGDVREAEQDVLEYVESELTAQSFKTACGDDYNEDCLYLDMYAPAENVTTTYNLEKLSPMPLV